MSSRYLLNLQYKNVRIDTNGANGKKTNLYLLQARLLEFVNNEELPFKDVQSVFKGVSEIQKVITGEALKVVEAPLVEAPLAEAPLIESSEESLTVTDIPTTDIPSTYNPSTYNPATYNPEDWKKEKPESSSSTKCQFLQKIQKAFKRLYRKKPKLE